jgi:hypothetical protein
MFKDNKQKTLDVEYLLLLCALLQIKLANETLYRPKLSSRKNHLCEFHGVGTVMCIFHIVHKYIQYTPIHISALIHYMYNEALGNRDRSVGLFSDMNRLSQIPISSY